MNSRMYLPVLALLALSAPAQAFEAPLTYARSELRIVVLHPKNPKDTPLRFDTEIRSAESAASSPGWYNFATMGDLKAAMLVYNAPTVATISRGNDYAATDILFVDPYGVIEQILPSLVSADLQEPVSSAEPLKAIIYLQGGTCAKLGIAPGDQVRYGAFQKRPVIITQPSDTPVPGAKDKPIPEPAPQEQPQAVQPPVNQPPDPALLSPSPEQPETGQPEVGQPAPPTSPQGNDQLINQIFRQNGGR